LLLLVALSVFVWTFSLSVAPSQAYACGNSIGPVLYRVEEPSLGNHSSCVGFQVGAGSAGANGTVTVSANPTIYNEVEAGATACGPTFCVLVGAGSSGPGNGVCYVDPNQAFCVP